MPPKRAPQDTEQLLCAMITLRGPPRGFEWQEVADLMPLKADGSKNSSEAVRHQWRRLRQKWDEDGIGSDTPPAREDEGDGSGSKASKPKPKTNGKGKEKGKVKTACKRKAKEESEDDDGEGIEEDSDAGINVAVSTKSLRLVKTVGLRPWESRYVEDGEGDGEEV